MLQWDATSLITCAKFQVNGRLVLDDALSAGKIIIVQEVQQETVTVGLAGGYPDAVEINTRIEAAQIEVSTAASLSPPFEEVLDCYGLHHGDKAVVHLALQRTEVAGTGTDDRLLWVVLRRCGHAALFLPDFIEQAVAEGAFDATIGQQLLLALRARLPVGFVEHSLRRLEGVI
jgi:hypothetical protein